MKGRAVTNLAVVECQEGVVREYIKDGVEGTMGSGEKEEEKKKNKKRVVRIEKLERHRFTTQTFIPMGSGGAPGAGEGEAGKGKYLVVVSAARDEGPDPKGVKAWVADGGVGVCYAPGVWHAGMCVIDETMIFGQVQYMNGVNHEDVEFFQLDEPLEIVF